MLERIRERRVVRDRARHPRRVLRRRLVARRPRLLRPRLRRRRRGGSGGGRGRRHARDRDARGRGVPRLARRSTGSARVPVHWHGHDDFGLGTAAAIAAVQAGATWVQGTINGMGERAGNADLDRGRARARGALRDPDAARPDARRARSRGSSRSGRARRSRRGRRSPARRSSRASRARSPRSSTTRRRSSRTPPSSSARSAGSCSARRAGSTRSGSRSSGSGSTSRPTVTRRCSPAVKRLGTEKQGLVTDDELRTLVTDLEGGTDGS